MPHNIPLPKSSDEEQKEFHRKLHIKYVAELDEKSRDTFEFQVTEHLRMSGIYWGLCGQSLLKSQHLMPREEILKFVDSCWNEEKGGYSGNVLHDAHLLYTLSAVQICALYDEMDRLDRDKIAKFIQGLQKEDGSFAGDEYGEIDTRFSYCALNCLSLIGKLDAINLDKAVEYVLKCQNFDGGFGVSPGAESHAGQIFCCVGALDIAGALDKIDVDQLAWWLCERQCPNGGLNGRPEKLADVCYSWWVLSSMSMMARLHWINYERLTQFIFNCQDPDDGGIGDKPGNMADVFHTFFGIAGLSLMGSVDNLEKIDPTYALPVRVLKKLNIRTRYSDRFVKE